MVYYFDNNNILRVPIRVRYYRKTNMPLLTEFSNLDRLGVLYNINIYEL